jgi:hypothetical protein
MIKIFTHRISLPEEVAVGNEGGRDGARRAANVVGAIFQVGMTGFASTRIEEIVREGPPSLVEPAGYAFGVWGLIFALSLVYAAYGALPVNRENPVLRRVGWFTAGAFFCTGLWSVFVPLRLFLPAQTMLLGIFAFLLVAYLRLARSERGVLSGADRWLVALPVGIFLGWVTAANAVSLTSEAVRLGLIDGASTSEALLGSVLLLAGGVLAAAIVLAGKTGPVQAYLTYGITVLWALTAVVVKQYDASLLTTGASLISAALVVAVLFGALRGDRPRRATGRRVRPRVV